VVTEKRDAGAIARFVRSGLIKYNRTKAGKFEYSRVILSARDGSRSVVGGLVCELFWNAMYIELLWIADTARGRGHGRRLMRQAEQTARQHGRQLIYLSTYSFQAPEFYEKLGYRRFGELEGHPPGASRMFYVKRLSSRT
jgi:ribosomal protein S18 acetylase RimI-like enzyme